MSKSNSRAMGKIILPLLAGIGGAIIGNKVASADIKFIPDGAKKFQGGIPVVGGMVIMSKSRNVVVQALGFGLAIGGGVQAVKVNLPQLGIGDADDVTDYYVNGMGAPSYALGEAPEAVGRAGSYALSGTGKDMADFG